MWARLQTSGLYQATNSSRPFDFKMIFQSSCHCNLFVNLYYCDGTEMRQCNLVFVLLSRFELSLLYSIFFESVAAGKYDWLVPLSFYHKEEWCHCPIMDQAEIPQEWHLQPFYKYEKPRILIYVFWNQQQWHCVCPAVLNFCRDTYGNIEDAHLFWCQNRDWKN